MASGRVSQLAMLISLGDPASVKPEYTPTMWRGSDGGCSHLWLNSLLTIKDARVCIHREMDPPLANWLGYSS